MKKPLVSIIIPMYKSEAFLYRAFDSILNQTYKNIELIAVNDGSPDKCLEIANNYRNADRRVKVIDQVNQGAASALNSGTVACFGEYIIYLDADDFLDVSTIEKAVNKALEYNVDLVLWSYNKFTNKNIIKGSKLYEEDKLFSDSNIDILKLRIIGLNNLELKFPTQTDLISAGWGKLYNANIIRNKIFWKHTDDVGSSDVGFNCEVFQSLKSAYYLSERLSYYFLDNPISLTKNYGLSLFDKYKNLFKHIEQLIKEQLSNLDYKVAFRNRVSISFINLTLSIIGAKGFGLVEKKRLFSRILNDSLYKESISNMNVTNLPFSFRVFYILAKLNWIIPLMIVGYAMYYIRKGINK